MRKGVTYATFYASAQEWREIAADLKSHGNRPLARAIEQGVRRQERRGWVEGMSLPLRFRDGSIPKLERYCNA